MSQDTAIKARVTPRVDPRFVSEGVWRVGPKDYHYARYPNLWLTAGGGSIPNEEEPQFSTALQAQCAADYDNLARYWANTIASMNDQERRDLLRIIRKTLDRAVANGGLAQDEHAHTDGT